MLFLADLLRSQVPSATVICTYHCLLRRQVALTVAIVSKQVARLLLILKLAGSVWTLRLRANLLGSESTFGLLASSLDHLLLLFLL